ncbi:actin-like ATPase domain-containing protein [Aspergillus taichungensis]|uniref:Actin-like ATPase domain-containing protein n=1 Tax=Aspergillus taichungensis TaxID=482145 RepID=A0A2J5HGV4_9EURO|nr:actin-like ATPase domain-containing protein [Aspergillus taichungensis]
MATNNSMGSMDKWSGRSSSGSKPDRIPGRIIVSVDYGTTATSFFLAEGQTDLSALDFIRTWPGNIESSKLPSSIAYQCDNSSFSMRSPCWGFELEHGMNAYSWTKLLLDGLEASADFDDEILTSMTSHEIVHPGQKQAVEVVSDYLRHVLVYAWSFMRSHISCFDQVPRDVRFTVPATWSQEARDSTERAVAQQWVGRGPEDTLATLFEPEAAARDGILVCDCGGGTVDIATYLVTDHRSFNMLKLTCVQGAKCGGTAIDSRLYDLMRQRLPRAFSRLNHLIAPGSQFMGVFEKAKQEFGLDVPLRPVRLPLKPRTEGLDLTLPYYDSEFGTLILSTKDLQDLFDPVISKIVALINSQIMAAGKAFGSPVINRIFLVGGVASSPYVQRAIHRCFDTPGKLTVTVPRDLDPALAVGAGSILHGLRCHYPSVLSSPRHYGLGSCQSPDMVQYGDRMVTWVVAKGENLRHGEVRIRTLYRSFVDHDATVMAIPVYSYEEPHRPDTAEDHAVELAGFIVADMSTNNLNGFNRVTTPEGTVYLLENRVETVFNARSGTLHFEVMALDAIIGTLTLPIRR